MCLVFFFWFWGFKCGPKRADMAKSGTLFTCWTPTVLLIHVHCLFATFIDLSKIVLFASKTDGWFWEFFISLYCCLTTAVLRVDSKHFQAAMYRILSRVSCVCVCNNPQQKRVCSISSCRSSVFAINQRFLDTVWKTNNSEGLSQCTG